MSDLPILLKASFEDFERAVNRGDWAPDVLGDKFRQLLDAVDENASAGEKIEAIKAFWAKGRASLPLAAPEREAPDPGMLAALGYHVRGFIPVPEKTRRRLLDYLLSSDDLPPVKDLHYMQQWGQARSSKRAGKLIAVLDKLAEKRFEDNHRYETASVRWDKDCEYVERRCAELAIKLR
jgi:hypothetical protein